MKSSTYGKGARGKATRLHSLVVRSRGKCEACSSTLNLQTAHIVGRRYAATRTDERNALCLCAACHMRFTDDPVAWVDYLEAKIGRGEYDRLRTKAVVGVKANDAFWRGECARLSVILAGETK